MTSWQLLTLPIRHQHCPRTCWHLMNSKDGCATKRSRRDKYSVQKPMQLCKSCFRSCWIASLYSRLNFDRRFIDFLLSNCRLHFVQIVVGTSTSSSSCSQLKHLYLKKRCKINKNHSCFKACYIWKDKLHWVHFFVYL